MASALAAVNTRLDGLTYCPHHPDDACLCRKPEPGMLLEMMQLFAVDPEDAVFVGDSLRDAQAAQAAGCRGVLVRTGNGLQAEAAARSQGLPVAVFDDLASFTRDLLGGSRRMR